jgi:hypothetical protein
LFLSITEWRGEINPLFFCDYGLLGAAIVTSELAGIVLVYSDGVTKTMGEQGVALLAVSVLGHSECQRLLS